MVSIIFGVDEVEYDGGGAKGRFREGERFVGAAAITGAPP